MFYRREIDGLRALAVLPVVMFHAGNQMFAGGFVGVDVFFVISGFLITSILIERMQEGTFSIVDFYERRARRILPALFLVITATILASWFVLMPKDMMNFSKSLISVPLFVSNILFYTESGYFDTAGELKPLLHTWSLAVEEQFYLFFPLLLWGVWRFGQRATIGVLILIAGASLAVAQWGAQTHAAATFFLPHTRLWELIIGAFVAFYIAGRKESDAPKWWANLQSATGFALILCAIFWFDKNTPFPSMYALLPTLGAAMIILGARPDTYVGRLLGSQPFVSVGLISYSVYLWHQPVFALVRHHDFVEPSQVTFLFLITLVLVMSYASWRFVEGPFRGGRLLGRAFVFRFALIGSLLFISVGAIGLATKGYFYRTALQAKVEGIESRLRINYGLDDICEQKFTLSEKCRTAEEPEVLLWGDSYAMHLTQGLISSNPGVKLVQMTVSQCSPVLGVAGPDIVHGAKNCIENNDRVFEYLKNTKSIKYVVLASPFSQLFSSGGLLTRSGKIEKTAGREVDYLKATLGAIKSLDKVPVIFSPTPSSGADVGRCLLKADTFDKPLSNCDFSLSTSKELQGKVLNMLSVVAKGDKVIWLSDYICPSGLCVPARGATLLYRDAGHLSIEGSALIGKEAGFYSLLSK